MVGRTDLLVQTDNVAEPHQGKVDLSAILNNPFAGKDQKVTFDPKAVYNFELEKTMDEKVLVKKCANAINKGQKTELSVNLTNIDRTFGTILGAEITRKNKNGLADDTITVHCNGAGGQSFGAFIPKGLTLELTGDSNDCLLYTSVFDIFITYYMEKFCSFFIKCLHGTKERSLFIKSFSAVAVSYTHL